MLEQLGLRAGPPGAGDRHRQRLQRGGDGAHRRPGRPGRHRRHRPRAGRPGPRPAWRPPGTPAVDVRCADGGFGDPDGAPVRPGHRDGRRVGHRPGLARASSARAAAWSCRCRSAASSCRSPWSPARITGPRPRRSAAGSSGWPAPFAGPEPFAAVGAARYAQADGGRIGGAAGAGRRAVGPARWRRPGRAGLHRPERVSRPGPVADAHRARAGPADRHAAPGRQPLAPLLPSAASSATPTATATWGSPRWPGRTRGSGPRRYGPGGAGRSRPAWRRASPPGLAEQAAPWATPAAAGRAAPGAGCPSASRRRPEQSSWAARTIRAGRRSWPVADGWPGLAASGPLAALVQRRRRPDDQRVGRRGRPAHPCRRTGSCDST